MILQIPKAKFKELLLEDGVVTAEQFDQAAEESLRMNQGIGDTLIGKNLIKEDYYYTLLARFYNVELANLSQRQVDEVILRLLTEDISRQRRVVLFSRREDGSIDAAMEDPSDLTTLQFLKAFLKADINPYLATREDLNWGFSLYSKKGAEEFQKVIGENIEASLRSGEKEGREAAEDLPIVAITDTVFSYALATRASDIHIEALDRQVLIRFRIDGILHEMLRIPKQVHAALTARMKLLAGLKLDEHLKPQDGRYQHKIGSDLIDVRVSIMPTFYGEKVEMRLLPATEHPYSFEELGMLPDTVAVLKENIAKTFGIFLVTGPTGSGKSTTLYSVISVLNKPEVNIVTVEDPIEYSMQYVNQTQVNAEAGITFANALRSFLRQDPNVIMVGEIRDEETAEIAVHAALTGHLVLSTLHTNDAPTAVPRLVDMHIQPFLVAAVINAIMAQRLVRRICMDCIVSYTPEPELEQMVRKQIEDMKIGVDFTMPKVIFRGTGCSSCGHIGYKGRMGIYEIFGVNEEIRRLIIDPNFNMDGLRDVARKYGFTTMFEDGLKKVERGMTTIEEVLRVIRE
jgi:type IV pilus assembly protein PilB